MSKTTDQTPRERRQALMDKDDGAGTDTVELRPPNDTGARHGYHVLPCPVVDEDSETVELTRLEAQRRGHTPCQRCVIGECESSQNGSGVRTCPLCGERVIRLPFHIRDECDAA